MARGSKLDISFDPLVFYAQSRRPLEWNAVFGRPAPLDVEIGCGLGEFLARQARLYPERNFVGIEQQWKRVRKILRKVSLRALRGEPENGLGNVRVLHTDARLALERLFPARSINKVYCLFPCPWPKKRHVKYRLFARDFFRLINNRLMDHGEIRIVTDHEPYFEWLREQSARSGFKKQEGKVYPQFDTKYERKWMAGGQKEFFELVLVKEKHVPVSVKKDAAMKIYTVKDFEPARFEFKKISGATTIVLRDFIFDPLLGRAMAHLIVAEPGITQDVWVSIVKGDKGWRIAKEEGVHFLPTAGAALAIKGVYEAALKSAGEGRAGVTC